MNDTMDKAIMEIVSAGHEVIFRKHDMTKHFTVRIENHKGPKALMLERMYDKHYPLGLVHAVRETYYHFNAGINERKKNERA